MGKQKKQKRQNRNSSQPVKIIKMGKYIFEYPQKKYQKNEIAKQILVQLNDNQKDMLDIGWGQYKKYKWRKVLKYMKQSQIERVFLSGNPDAKILKSISHINFLQLKVLEIRSCQLVSIQGIPSCPTLQFLSLMNNRIRSIEYFKRCNFKGLKTLLLNDNPIARMCLDRCNTQLQVFWLQRQFNQLVIGQSLILSSIFKLKSKQMRNISIQNHHRIYQGRHIENLKKKYVNLQVLNIIENTYHNETQIITYENQSDQYQQAFSANEENDVEPPFLHQLEGTESQDWNIQETNYQHFSLIQNQQKQQIQSEEEPYEIYDYEWDDL